MPSPPARQLSPDEIARIGLLYAAGAPVASITAEYGIPRCRFYRLRQIHNWPFRDPKARLRTAPNEPAPVPPVHSEAPDLGDLAFLGAGPMPFDIRDHIARLERLAAGHMAALERGAGRVGDPEAAARAAAIYARTLETLQKLKARLAEEPKPDDQGPPARSLAELRDELRRHLVRVCGEGRRRRNVGRRSQLN